MIGMRRVGPLAGLTLLMLAWLPGGTWAQATEATEAEPPPPPVEDPQGRNLDPAEQRAEPVTPSPREPVTDPQDRNLEPEERRREGTETRGTSEEPPLSEREVEPGGRDPLATGGTLETEIDADLYGVDAELYGGGTLRTRIEPVPSGVPADVREGALQLSLEEAVEIALVRNLGLLVERYDRIRSAVQAYGALGIYDTLASALAAASDTEAATVTTLRASQSESQSFNFGFDQLTPWGGVASLDWNNSRSEDNNQFSLLNPAYFSGLDLTFTQPLLRDFGRLATERSLRVARVNSSISREQLEQEVEGVILDVQEAYWLLIDTQEQLAVSRESLALAQELHARNRIEVEVGTRAPLELVQSEATIATREEDIIRTEGSVGDAEDRLRQLLNLPPELWTAPIATTTDPVLDPIEIDLERAIATALAERPELATQRLVIERNEIDARFFENQEKPQLDLVVNYGLEGLGGFGQRPSEDDLDTDLGDAVEQILDQDFPGFSVQLQFGFPIQNRTARANSLAADLALEQERTRFDDLELQILTQVRQAVRQVETARQQITSARATSGLQERNLEAQQKRYENGMATSFEVTEVQEDLALARSREVAAVTNYRIALARYHEAIGLLLEEAGVEMLDDASEVTK